MNYGIYKNVRDSSWQCLLDAGITELPVSVVKIAEHFDVKLVKNSHRNWLTPCQSGISIMTEDGTWIICYDDNDSMERIRFTIAHELGHILLGHPLREGFVHTRTIAKERPQVESEADMFAARILAPACVLWALDLHTAEEIANVCKISYAAAQVRVDRMKILYERNKFLASPLEKELFGRFSKFIEENKNRR